MKNKNDNTRNVHEPESIAQEMQEVSKGIEEVERNITYATYISALHDLEVKVTFWQTLALTILSFVIFGTIFIIMLLLLA